MWHLLSPTLTEFVTLEEKIQKNLMDLAKSCPVSALEDIEGRRSPHKEASATPADYEDLKRRAVERVTESIRHVRRTAKEIEAAGAALCHTRELRSEAEVAKTEHSHPLGMVVSTHFRCGKGVKRGLKNGALPFNID